LWQAVKELAEGGTDRAAHHAVFGRGRTPGRPDRDPARGRIIANGTLAELKQLLPPATVEYVEKQPTLGGRLPAIVGATGTDGDAGHATTSAPTSKERHEQALLR
jgi:ABC-2 type transport system ATP-binding protein